MLIPKYLKWLRYGHHFYVFAIDYDNNKLYGGVTSQLAKWYKIYNSSRGKYINIHKVKHYLSDFLSI